MLESQVRFSSAFHVLARMHVGSMFDDDRHTSLFVAAVLSSRSRGNVSGRCTRGV